MLENSLLDSILDHVANQLEKDSDTLGDDLVIQLRTMFSGVHFSVCNDDDVPPRLTPAAGNAHCHLYYVDSSGHCLQLTNDAESATGFLIGLLDEVAA